MSSTSVRLRRIPRLYAAGDVLAIWRTDEAFIKASDIMSPQAIREYVTLSRQGPGDGVVSEERRTLDQEELCETVRV